MTSHIGLSPGLGIKAKTVQGKSHRLQALDWCQSQSPQTSCVILEASRMSAQQLTSECLSHEDDHGAQQFHHSVGYLL